MYHFAVDPALKHKVGAYPSHIGICLWERKRLLFIFVVKIPCGYTCRAAADERRHRFGIII